MALFRLGHIIVAKLLKNSLLPENVFGKLIGATTAWERLVFSPAIKGRLIAHNSQIARSNNALQQPGGGLKGS